MGLAPQEIYEHGEIDEKCGKYLGGIFETLWSHLFKIEGMTKCMSNTIRVEIDLQNRKSWKAIGLCNWGMVCYAKDIKRRELWTGESNEGVWKIVDREALLFFIYIYIYIWVGFKLHLV